MNSDIRLSVDFFEHPKTLKLERRLGHMGVTALIRLWCFAAKHRSDGVLYNMDFESIDLAAKFNDDSSTIVKGSLTSSRFVETLVELRWLELSGDGVTYRIHDWKTHNSYAADAEDRSESSRLSRLSGVNRAAYDKLVSEGRTGITREEYDSYKKSKLIPSDVFDDSSTVRQAIVEPSLSPTPTPAPTPVPTPIDKREKNFVPPLLKDVSAYCAERGNGVDPSKWFDFYASKGWLIGKNKMKDWRAAVRTWEKSGTGDIRSAAAEFGTPEYQAALQRTLAI